MNRISYQLIIVALVAAAVYLGALRCGIIWDDRFLIIENRYLRDWSELRNNLLNDFFRKSRDTSQIGYWRPVVSLSYMIDRTLYNDKPWGFHLQNIIIHSLVSCLVLIMFRYLPLPRGVPLGAALLFAVHPVHVESVAWISGRTDLFCTLFALAALNLDLDNAKKPHPFKVWGSVLATALALLSKEMAVIIPGLIFLRTFLVPGERETNKGKFPAAIGNTMPHAATLVGYLIVHYGILHISPNTASLMNVGRSVFFWTWWKGFLEYLRVLVYPAVLSIEIELHLERSMFSASVMAGMAVFILFLVLTWKMRRIKPALSYLLWFFLISFIPITNFLSPIMTPSQSQFAWNERFLYIPSVAFSGAMSWFLLAALPDGIRRLRRLMSAVIVSRKGWAILTFIIVLASLASRTVARVNDWKDNLSLFSSALRHAPESSLIRTNYGMALADIGRLDEAEKELIRAIGLKPDEYKAHFNLGNVYREKGDLAHAESEYRTAIRIKPGYAQSYLNLGIVFYRTGRIEEALEAFTKADELLPDHVEAKINRANILRLMGRSREAIQFYRQALELEPEASAASLGLAGAFLETGREEEAETLLRRLIADEPDMAEAHLLMAIYLDRKGMRAEAEIEYREVLRINPDHKRVRQRLGIP
ncbi:MAG: tetratricopeptide repeat protein [Acidobacteriota bacterium]